MTAKKRPLGIDLFCGLGGWSDGLLSEGYDVVGFDIERHKYGDHEYPGQLVLQDVLTLHGSQFKDATLIVASPPCQAYSYRAMPWKRAKAMPPPDNSLFEACFRIQREASEAAGSHVPMIVENVRGAQKWVGRARWHFGSFYLWGDVPALMPMTKPRPKVGGFSWSDYGKDGYVGQAFNSAAVRGMKNSGGSWFAIGPRGELGARNNPTDGIKTRGHTHKRNGHRGTQHLTNPAESQGVKQGGDWFNETGPGALRSYNSKSLTRRAASALIAKIPFRLAVYIAHHFKWRPEC